MIGKTFSITALQNVSTPASIQGCHSLVGSGHTPFKEYVVCPVCHMLFHPKSCPLTEGTSSNKISVVCKYIKYPKHTQGRFRVPCNTPLMYAINKKGNKRISCPKDIHGLKTALSHLINRPSFLHLCNSWRSRQATENLMGDITDGNVWTEMIERLANNGNSENLLGFVVNVDWFQPFKDISYSVGVIYAVVINLPRNLRYKEENVIIVGVIPGPKEPSKNINSYLGPFVQELLELYSGTWFTTSHGRQLVRGVLVCISSDIPATRKVAGFMGHNALKGCSRCLSPFLQTHKQNDRLFRI